MTHTCPQCKTGRLVAEVVLEGPVVIEAAKYDSVSKAKSIDIAPDPRHALDVAVDVFCMSCRYEVTYNNDEVALPELPLLAEA